MTGADVVGVELGRTSEKPSIARNDTVIPLCELSKAYEGRLESVYPCKLPTEEKFTAAFDYKREGPLPAPRVAVAKPHALIPVFPGTNCEYDTARASATSQRPRSRTPSSVFR